ncbi:hypothetical protein [Streptomyces sp. NPDC050504]|uniref:hypothetical protein n=1 Tax=Streptomyces sp. NPDC050504 TaxID=3365618 RepID=UPI0037B2680A
MPDPGTTPTPVTLGQEQLDLLAESVASALAGYLGLPRSLPVPAAVFQSAVVEPAVGAVTRTAEEVLA